MGWSIAFGVSAALMTMSLRASERDVTWDVALCLWLWVAVPLLLMRIVWG